MIARINRGVAVGLTFLVVLAGCTTGVEPVPPEVDQAQVQFAEFLEAALEADISDAQREVLLQARAGDVIEYVDVERLFADTHDCYDDAGVEYIEGPPREVAPGIFMSTNVFRAPEGDPGALAKADWCIDFHNYYAYAAYQGQPSTIEAMDREFDRHIPQMIECIRKTGVSIEDSATRAEIEAAIIEGMSAPNPEMCDYRNWS